MAFDEGVAERLREPFEGRFDIVEKKMFGGIAFMHSGNMCCGIVGDELMLRVGPDAYAGALEQKHARAMDFTGKPMRGMVYVAEAGIENDGKLAKWVARGVAFAGALAPK